MSVSEKSEAEAPEFERLCDSIVDEYWWERRRKTPETVYHYTNSFGLEGILKSSEIFAVDRRFMNDASESLLGLELIKNEILDRIDRSSGAKQTFLKALLRYVDDDDDDDPNFLFSLTDRKDDLSQWRSYAQDGAGFAIGFSVAQLERYGKASQTFSFGPVHYNARQFTTRVRECLNSFADLIPDEASVQLTDDAASCCEVALKSLSCQYKHSSFKSEREWRINTYPDDEDTVRVNPKPQGLTPYFALPLALRHENLPVVSIGIGPAFKGAEIEYAVKRLAIQHGYEPEIYFADSPYRKM